MNEPTPASCPGLERVLFVLRLQWRCLMLVLFIYLSAVLDNRALESTNNLYSSWALAQLPGLRGSCHRGWTSSILLGLLARSLGERRTGLWKGRPQAQVCARARGQGQGLTPGTPPCLCPHAQSTSCYKGGRSTATRLHCGGPGWPWPAPTAMGPARIWVLVPKPQVDLCLSDKLEAEAGSHLDVWSLECDSEPHSCSRFCSAEAEAGRCTVSSDLNSRLLKRSPGCFPKHAGLTWDTELPLGA